MQTQLHPDDQARLDSIIAANAAGSRTPTITSKINATAIDNVAPDKATNSTPLGTVAYKTATVLAWKPGADATTAGVANTGNVYIHTNAASIAAAFVLVPGASVELPPFADLSDFHLSVDTANDGVIIAYTV